LAGLHQGGPRRTPFRWVIGQHLHPAFLQHDFGRLSSVVHVETGSQHLDAQARRSDPELNGMSVGSFLFGNGEKGFPMQRYLPVFGLLPPVGNCQRRMAVERYYRAVG